MASRFPLAVLAAVFLVSSSAFASDQSRKQNPPHLFGAIANSLQPSAGSQHQDAREAADPYNRYNSGYQTHEQIGQGLHRNVMNNLNQIPPPQHIPSRVDLDPVQ